MYAKIKADLPFRAKLIYLVLLLCFVQACTNFDLEDYNPYRIPLKTQAQLESYADTSLTLTRIRAIHSTERQLDSLILIAEVLRNTDPDASLYYAQIAYDIATEKNWSIPRGVSANRMAWGKGSKAESGEDLEDALVGC